MDKLRKKIWKFFKTPITDHVINLWNILRNFFISPTRSRWFAIIGIIVIVIALPVTVIVLQQRTIFFQHAYIDCTSDWIQCAGQTDGGSTRYCTNIPSDHQVHVYQPARCNNAPYCVDLGRVPGQCGVPTCHNTTTPNVCHGNQVCTAYGNTCSMYVTYANCSYQVNQCGYNSCSNVGGTCTKSSCASPSHQLNGACPAGDWTCCSNACNNQDVGGAVCCKDVGVSTYGEGHLCQKHQDDTCATYYKDAGFSNACSDQCSAKGGHCEKYQCGNAEVAIGGACSFADSACCKAGTPTFTCGIAGSTNSFSGTDGSVTYCPSGKACSPGSQYSTNNGTSDASNRLCLFASDACEIRGGHCEKYWCGNNETQMNGSCTIGDSTCCKPNSNPTYTCSSDATWISGSNGTVTYCDSGYICDTSKYTANNGYPTGNGPTDAKNKLCVPSESACVNFDHVLPWDSCTDKARVIVPKCPYPQDYSDAGVDNWCDWLWPGPFCGPTKNCVYKGPKNPPPAQPFHCGAAGTNSYCSNGVYNSNKELSCPTGHLATVDYNGCSQYALCCINDNSLTPIPTPPPPSDQHLCTNAGGSCYFNLAGCPATLPKNLGAMDCNPPAFCCAPSSGGGCDPSKQDCGGGGGNPTPTLPGGGCTNGKDTELALSLKLDGIGTGSIENTDPKRPNRSGKVRVFDTGNSNGSINSSSQAFNYGKGDGKFDSTTIDIGNNLSCGNSYKVEVRLPGYLPITSDVKYGETSQVISMEPIGGDINQVDNNGIIVGDGKVDINDYSIYRQCRNVDPNTTLDFKSASTTVKVKCGDLINFFDFQDGGTMENNVFPASGIGEWDANYNLWLRWYLKANGF